MNTYIVGLHGGTRFIINAHGYYQATNGGREEYVFVLHGPATSAPFAASMWPKWPRSSAARNRCARRRILAGHASAATLSTVPPLSVP